MSTLLLAINSLIAVDLLLMDLAFKRLNLALLVGLKLASVQRIGIRIRLLRFTVCLCRRTYGWRGVTNV